MARNRNDVSFIVSPEVLLRIFRFRGRHDAITGTMQHDRRYADRRLARQPLFQPFESRVASSYAIPVTIGLNGNGHKVGIVEARSRGVERLFSEMPVRRPQVPKQPSNRATILRKSRDATVGVQIPLVPVAQLLLRGRRAIGGRYVLNVVSGDGHEPNDPLGPECGSHAGGAPTPVVANEYCRRYAKRVHEVA